MARTGGTEETVIRSLLGNPDAIPNEAIRVWVQRQSSLPEDFFEGVDEWCEKQPSGSPLEPIPMVEQVRMKPGQYLLRFVESGIHLLDSLIWFPPSAQSLSLSKGRFLLGAPTYFYHGVYLGDCRLLRSAGKRALKESGERDWIGGIGDFARQFLRAPRRRASEAAQP